MIEPSAVEEATRYVRRSIEAQRRLGYRSRVSKDVLDRAIAEAARAVAPYLKLRTARGRKT
jgi:hypothetical protein